MVERMRDKPGGPSGTRQAEKSKEKKSKGKICPAIALENKFLLCGTIIKKINTSTDWKWLLEIIAFDLSWIIVIKSM